MNLPVCCLLAAVLGTGALTVQARERVEERRFATNGVPTLKIDCYRGSINVDSDDEPTIRVQVAASSAIENEERAEQLLQRLKFDWSQADNAITLKVANPAETGVRYLWEENQILDLVLKVTIPRTCHLDLVTKEGSLRLGEVQGNVRLKTSRGTIFCRMIDGNIFGRIERGDIVISRCRGDIDLATQQGSIRAGTVSGQAVLSTINGDIELSSARGGLRAKTDGGDVTAGIPTRFSGEGTVSTNGGNIRLKIAPAAKVAIEASSVWGKVRATHSAQSKLNLAIESGGFGRKSLIGKLNGGGPVVRVHASGGYIDLFAETPPFTE